MGSRVSAPATSRNALCIATVMRNPYSLLDANARTCMNTGTILCDLFRANSRIPHMREMRWHDASQW